MAELTPKDTVRILGECVEALSEISRDPAVYGDAAAALALGTLCYYADPAKVVGRNAQELPDGSFVVFAVTGHLDANRARQLAKGGDLFRNAAQSVKPFLARAQHLLVKAGQTFPVATVLERARARVEQAAAQVVGITVPELDPAPYTTLVGVMRPNAHGEIELDAGVPDEPVFVAPNGQKIPVRDESSRRLRPQAPVPEEGEQFVIGEKDEALSSDDRTILKGFRADRTTPVSLQEYKSTHLTRDDFKPEIDAWVKKLQQVQDAHAVGVIGVHRANSKLYLVYEEMSGQTLQQLLTRGPLDESDVYSTLESLALGLKAYHGAGLIHKGLRPDRVLIDRDGTVRVFDPPPPKPPRPAGEEETLREKGLKGEVRYMSPEVCTAADGHTAAADVYSLGLMVCEMLLGEQNLQRIAGESVKFWLNWHVDLYKKAVPLTEIDPEISAELSEVVSKMLEKRVKNRYADCGQVLGELAAFRTGKKKAPKPAAQARSNPGRPTQTGPALGGLQAMMTKAGVTPRTLALAGAVGFMFFLCVVAAIFVAFRDDGEQVNGGGTATGTDEPCKKALEDALIAFRNEDYEGTARKLDALAKEKCGTAGEEAKVGLRRDLDKAKGLKERYRTAMASGKELEAAGKIGDSIAQFQIAAKSFKELSTTLQQPSRPMPEDLAKKLEALEPVRLLDDAKTALKNDDPEQAKHLANMLLDNHAGSAVAREAEEFSKVVVQVRETLREYSRQLALGREADGTSRYFEAATCYWNAKNAWEMAQRLSGALKPLPVDLKERLTAVYPKVWSVKSPPSDALVENEDLVFELIISERFFKEVSIGKKTLPVKGEFMTVKMSELGAGSHIVEVAAISVDGQRSMRKIAFRFQPPEEQPPKIEVKSIAGSKDHWIAEIEYNGAPFSAVAVGWKPPDGKFTVVTLTGTSVTVQTLKKNRFFFQP